MKKLILALIGLSVMGAGYQIESLKEVVSIIRLADGNFDVLCNDHSREIVTEADVLNNNLCPHVPQNSAKKLDILFVVDNSASMQTSQQVLASQAKIIFKDLLAQNIDFQIAFTTTEAYRAAYVSKPSYSEFRSYNGVSVLTPKTPDLANIFEGLARQGATGSGDERAFQSIRESLLNPTNAGFFRADSFLSVFILSDEDDVSHDGSQAAGYEDPSLHPVQLYFDFLKQFTQSNQNLNFQVSAIGVFDQACAAQMGGRPIAKRYAALADATGGKKIDICGPTFDISWKKNKH